MVLDILSLLVSGGEAGAATLFYGIAAVGCATGAGCVPAVIDAVYIDYKITSFAEPVESGLAGLSLAATFVNDLLEGNTTITSNNVYIGKDTLVSLRNTALGLVPLSLPDVIASGSQVKYDLDRLNNQKSGGSIAAFTTQFRDQLFLWDWW